jgi:alpha-beta hydrolase superfamily lysophospholipase
MMPASRDVERFLVRDREVVSEAGRTILLRHEGVRPRAVMLLHGLTAGPAQFRRFANDLFARGHNVFVPRLPLHGYRDRLTTALADFDDAKLRIWARESLAAARELGDRVTIAGFSAGGTLALWLAQQEHADRVVAIAPFLGLARLPSWITGFAMRTLLLLPNRFFWWNPFARERIAPAYGYPRFPTHAIARLYRIAEEVTRNAPGVPKARSMAFVTNSGESSVSNRAVLALAQRWAQHGFKADVVTLKQMPPSHDVIEPDYRPELAARVYSKVLGAIDPCR